MNEERRECYAAGYSYGQHLGPEGHRKIIAMHKTGESFMEYIYAQAGDMPHPQDFGVGVLTGLGIMVGTERVYYGEK